MQENKIVAHTLDGRVVKGLTHDFDPAREFFHILPAEGGGVPVRLRLGDLKALFFVRDYLGNREYNAPRGFGPAPPQGRRCVVTFTDGEVIFGFTPDHEDGAAGFTLYPSDPTDNNLRLFVASAAVRSIQFP